MTDQHIENEQKEDQGIESQETMSMADFMDEIEKSMAYVSRGDIISGTVVNNNGEYLVVNIGHMADGVVLKDEVDFDGGEGISEIEVGEVYKFYVIKADDGEGNIALSKKRADAELLWDSTEGMVSDQRPITVRIKEVIKGGLIAHYKGIRVFIPLSQVSMKRVEEPEKLVGTNLQVLVTEVQEEKKSMVASGRLLEEREAEKQRASLFETLAEGQVITGTVKRLADFGAFVDLGGIDGLIHLGDLSWKRIKNAAEAVSVGQTVKVTVLKIDAVNHKIGLRLTDFVDNPWDNIHNLFNEGDVVMGRVVRLQPFGAFVELREGLEGLVHISQISEERISKPQEKLHLDQDVKVMIMGINVEDKRISLSIKEAENAELEDFEDYLDEEVETSTLGDLFADKLKQFKF